MNAVYLNVANRNCKSTMTWIVCIFKFNYSILMIKITNMKVCHGSCVRTAVGELDIQIDTGLNGLDDKTQFWAASSYIDYWSCVGEKDHGRLSEVFCSPLKGNGKNMAVSWRRYFAFKSTREWVFVLAMKLALLYSAQFIRKKKQSNYFALLNCECFLHDFEMPHNLLKNFWENH